ncbi:MAG: NAD(P)/FAD-dependent oxidoreductase [Sandaracinaceae bacterium]
MTQVDVAILGGGLSGNLLARQLRREVPDASVMMVEKSDRPRWKVGESTVEIAAHYLMKRQQLGTYLYDHHLPKNGLRFFFDNQDKSAELTEMSEVGTDRPPPTPSFQLDRARFETDLRAMNDALGVDLRQGTAKRVQLGDGGAHRFTVEGADGSSDVQARWLIDGTGRTSTIARQLDLRHEVQDHRLMAVWGRFTGVVDFDTVGDHAFRQRVRYCARTLSTNHFCYPGYWIWFIPLGRGVTSIGIVGKREVFRRGIRTEEGMLSFLREHAAVASLIEKAEPLDIAGYTRLAYGVDRFFHGKHRWALLGDAAAFTDPFYSPGSDFIALECDYATDLIRRDLAGESADEVHDVSRTFDAFMKFRWHATMLLYKDLYETFGSYELMRVKLNFDLGCYYNVWLDPVVSERHLDPRFLMGELRRAKDTMNALGAFRDLFRTVEAKLRADGTYFEGNLGRYNRGVDCLASWLDEVGTPRSKRAITRRTEEVFNYGRGESLKLLGAGGVSDPTPWRLHQFTGEVPLAGHGH